MTRTRLALFALAGAIIWTLAFIGAAAVCNYIITTL